MSRYSTSSQAYGSYYQDKKSESSLPRPGRHARDDTHRELPTDVRGYPTRQHGAGYQPHLDPVPYDTYDYGHGHGRRQDQVQTRRQRSTQASKQMAYDVFGNVITALETFEDRQANKGRESRHGRSNISIPDQRFKDDEDVKASVEAQLRVFEAHMKHCPAEVRDEIRPEMKKMTAEWMAARRSRDTTETDRYAANLFEILGKGSTTHNPIPTQKQMGKDELLNNFSKVMYGQSKADALDRGFENNPNKKARAPDVRKGGSTEQGLRRLEEVNSSLARYTHDIPGYYDAR